jgi:PadR family transcriptional regulator
MEISLLELQLLLAINTLRHNAHVGSILSELNKCTQRCLWLGTIYAALDRLEERCLVKKVLEAKPSPKRGGKRKFFWALTKLGRRTLARTLRTILPFLGTITRSVRPQLPLRTQSVRRSAVDARLPRLALAGQEKGNS